MVFLKNSNPLRQQKIVFHNQFSIFIKNCNFFIGAGGTIVVGRGKSASCTIAAHNLVKSCQELQSAGQEWILNMNRRKMCRRAAYGNNE